MSNREVMQQALEALEESWHLTPMPDYARHSITALKAALEQQAEPSQWRDMVVVSLVREGVNKHKARELADHFAAPPQRQWVELTDEEIQKVWDVAAFAIPGWSRHIAYGRAIDAKLKERNT